MGVLRSRDPVSFGDLKGTFHLSGSLLEPKKTNDRSSRRGNEQTRLKLSVVVEDRWSDLTVGDNPWNETRKA